MRGVTHGRQHNSGSRDEVQRRYVLKVKAISIWIGLRHVKEALGRQQFGDLSGIDRLFTARSATPDKRQFYVTNPLADVAFISEETSNTAAASASQSARLVPYRW